jgi:hypothetical protein
MRFPISFWVVVASVLGAALLALPVRLWLSWVERNAKRESIVNLLSLASIVPVFYVFLCWTAFVYTKVSSYVQEQQQQGEVAFMSYVFALLGVVPAVLVHSLTLYSTDDRSPKSWRPDGTAVFRENQDFLGAQHAVVDVFLCVPIILIAYTVFCFFPSTPKFVAGWMFRNSPVLVSSVQADASSVTVRFYKSEIWWCLTVLGTYAMGFGHVIRRKASSPEAAVGLRPAAGFAMVTTAYGVALVIGVYIFASNGWQGGVTSIMAGWISSVVFARLRGLFYFYLEG